MSHKVNFDTGSIISVDSSVSSAQVNSGGKRAHGRFVSDPAGDGTRGEFVGNAKNFEVDDLIFDSGIKPSTVITRVDATAGISGKHTQSTKQHVGVATDLTKITSIDYGNGVIGNDTRFLHQSKLTSVDSYTKGFAWSVRFVLGDKIGSRSGSTSVY